MAVKLIGKSLYGQIYLCKILDEEDSSRSSQFFELREYNRIKLKLAPDGSNAIDAILSLHHNGIVKVHEIIDDPDKLATYIVCESIPGVNVQKKFKV